MKGQAVHLEHNCFSPPALDSPQATAFGRLRRKHSDPGMAVDLVGQMFTLEHSYQARGVSTVGSWYLPSPCGTQGTFPIHCKALLATLGAPQPSGVPPSHTEPSFCIGVYAALSTDPSSSDPYQAPLGGKGGNSNSTQEETESEKKLCDLGHVGKSMG